MTWILASFEPFVWVRVCSPVLEEGRGMCMSLLFLRGLMGVTGMSAVRLLIETRRVSQRRFPIFFI